MIRVNTYVQLSQTGTPWGAAWQADLTGGIPSSYGAPGAESWIYLVKQLPGMAIPPVGLRPNDFLAPFLQRSRSGEAAVDRLILKVQASNALGGMLSVGLAMMIDPPPAVLPPLAAPNPLRWYGPDVISPRSSAPLSNLGVQWIELVIPLSAWLVADSMAQPTPPPNLGGLPFPTPTLIVSPGATEIWDLQLQLVLNDNITAIS